MVFVVLLNLGRSVTWAIFTQGFFLDEDPDNYTYDDFVRAIVNQTLSSITDFFNGISIFLVIYLKNKEVIQSGNQDGVPESKQLRFSDLMSRNNHHSSAETDDEV